MCFRFYFIVLLCCVSRSFCDEILEKVSNIEWLCADEKCTKPISVAKPIQFYSGDHQVKVPFSPHENVNIIGKPTDKNEKLWLVSVGDKRGVAPSHLLKELKVFLKPAECISAKFDFREIITKNSVENSPKSSINPSPTQEVFDGTTIPVLESSYVNGSDPEFDDEATVTTDESSETWENDIKTPNMDINLADKIPISLDKDKEETTPSVFPDSQSPSLSNSILDSNIYKFENNTEASGNETIALSQNSDTPISEQELSPISVAVGNDREKALNLEPASNALDLKNLNDTQSEEVQPQSQQTTNSDNEHISSTDGTTATTTLEHSSNNLEINTEPSNVNLTESGMNLSEEKRTNVPYVVTIPPFDKETLESTTVMPEQVSEATKTENASERPNYSEYNDDRHAQPSVHNPYYTYGSQNKDSSQMSTSDSQTKESSSTSAGLNENTDNMNTKKIRDPYKYEQTTTTSQSPLEEIKSESQSIPETLGSTPSPLPAEEYSSSTEKYTETPQDLLVVPPSETPMEHPTSSETHLEPETPLEPQAPPETPPEPQTPLPLQPLASFLEPQVPLVTPLETQAPSENGPSEKILEPQASTEIPLEPQASTEIPLEPQAPLDISQEPQDILEDSNTDWFSPVNSIITSLKEMFTKSDIGVDDSQTIYEFTTESSYNTFQSSNEQRNVFEDSNQSCEKNGFCNTYPEVSAESSVPFSIPGFEGSSVSGSTLIYAIVTSSVIILFSLGYYYVENLKRDTELIAKINSLSAELFFAQKELTTMEEQISTTSENFEKLATNKTVNDEELNKMKRDLDETEAVNAGLELEIKRLEKEIESLVESNDEMHKMLTESISEEDRTQSLLANIADLKSVLSDKLDEIANVTDQLDKEKQEVELVTIALQKTEEQKENLEEKLQKILNEIDSKALAVAKEFEEKVTSLEKIIEDISLERTDFEKELCELKVKCEKLSAEKELSEKALKKAQGIGPGKALSEWLDTKEVRVELIATQKEVEKLRRELEEAKEHESKLQEQKNELQLEIETLNNSYETAEKTKIETLTKLQVLSNYFKEKEIQLQEELGDRESQWLQKQSEDHTIYEQMRTLREENLSYKAQNEALKKEILDQEASFKIQIANEEQKSQENWVTLRHTERRLKETQMEAAHLRSRLTALETNPDSLDDKHKSLDMVNGEVGLGPGSPPFMLYPPPPPDFIPPPPLVSPSRPPPLGRLSSPPLTPPPPLSPYDLFPHPPTAPSPPTHRGVIKPHPRDPIAHRKQKESQSSNHSSESMEKPVRRGKR